jgi:hypothetical protein
MQTYQKAVCTVLFLLITPCTLLHAQSPAFKKPADYNDYIVMEQTAIGRKIEQFNQALAGDDIKNAKKLHAEILSQIDVSIGKIGNLPDFKGNSEFKNAAFELFVFYKMIIETDYKKIMTIVEKEGLNDNSFGKINSIFTSIQRDETVMYGQFDRAQKNFSKQFGMKLEENELEKEWKEKTQPEPAKP